MADTSDSVVLITIDRNDIVNTSPITINKNLFNQPFPNNRKMFEGTRPLSTSEKRKLKEKMWESYLRHRKMAYLKIDSNQTSN